MRVRMLRQYHEPGRALFDGQVYDLENGAELCEAGVAEDADMPAKARDDAPEDKALGPRPTKRRGIDKQDAPGGLPLSEIAGTDGDGKFTRRDT